MNFQYRLICLREHGGYVMSPIANVHTTLLNFDMPVNRTLSKKVRKSIFTKTPSHKIRPFQLSWLAWQMVASEINVLTRNYLYSFLFANPHMHDLVQ